MMLIRLRPRCRLIERLRTRIFSSIAGGQPLGIGAG
jgi:hypothetical protein